MNPLEQDIQSIVDAIAALRIPAMPGEYDIHTQIDAALDSAGIDHSHEYKLAPRCRIDFLAGRIGIEVKKGRPAPASLHQQISRYLNSESLDAVVVVTQQAVNLPNMLAGKPIRLISLNRLWGVALP